MDELESMKYVLMTDDGGDVYTNAVVSYMKKNIGYETVKNLYSQYSSLNENKSAGEYDRQHYRDKHQKWCSDIPQKFFIQHGIFFRVIQ